MLLQFSRPQPSKSQWVLQHQEVADALPFYGVRTDKQRPQFLVNCVTISSKCFGLLIPFVSCLKLTKFNVDGS